MIEKSAKIDKQTVLFIRKSRVQSIKTNYIRVVHGWELKSPIVWPLLKNYQRLLDFHNSFHLYFYSELGIYSQRALFRTLE